MRKGREEKRRFLTEDHEAFFRAIASGLSEIGIVTLHFLELDKVRVASCLCFDYNGQRLLYNSGFNPEHSNLSVGLLLKASCLGDSISNGLEYFDFLKGDEQYKYHLGGIDRVVYKLSITR
jgi:CelD/BcsL family acetyltransferase involved in cellulose biosynthesis